MMIVFPEHIRFTRGPGESQGILVDQSENLVVRLNEAGCLAWQALSRPWSEACAYYSQLRGLTAEKAEEELGGFAGALNDHGWVQLLDDDGEPR